MNRKRLIALTPVAILLVAVLVVFSVSPARLDFATLEPLVIDVTKRPGQHAAELTVNNPTSHSIWIYAAQPQIKSASGWSENVNLLPAPYTSIGPRRSAKFAILGPTNATAWRVPFFWGLQPTKTEQLQTLVSQNIDALKNGTPLTGFRGGVKIHAGSATAYSPEINP